MKVKYGAIWPGSIFLGQVTIDPEAESTAF